MHGPEGAVLGVDAVGLATVEVKTLVAKDRAKATAVAAAETALAMGDGGGGGGGVDGGDGGGGDEGLGRPALPHRMPWGRGGSGRPCLATAGRLGLPGRGASGGGGGRGRGGEGGAWRDEGRRTEKPDGSWRQLGTGRSGLAPAWRRSSLEARAAATARVVASLSLMTTGRSSDVGGVEVAGTKGTAR
jgi:hypothetical protein